MTVRTLPWIIWLALAALTPVPFFMIEGGWMPLYRLVALAALTSAAVATDPGFDSYLAAGLLVPQALGYCALAGLVARALQRRLAVR